MNASVLKQGQIFKNYKEICNHIEEPMKTGKSKQLQLVDWNRYFTYNKDGNKFVIVEVFEKELEKVANYTSNNIKNIKLMIDYLMSKHDIAVGQYFSMTTWYCDQLELLNKDVCNIVYQSSDEISEFCRINSVNDKLLSKYVSATKSILKDMLLKALNYMQKKQLVTFEYGHMFIYKLSRKSLGYFCTDELNEIIITNETSICNEMNVAHNLSKKLKGRQNLLVIYGNEELTKEFNDKKVKMLMHEEDAVNTCNNAIQDYYGDFYEFINEDHPILSYYAGISINELEEIDANTIELAYKLSDNIKQRVRKQLHITNDAETIEHLLFRYNNKDESDLEDILNIFKGE